MRFHATLLGGILSAAFLLNAGPIEDLQPGHWVKLPCVNTIGNVLPVPPAPGNAAAIIIAWNSGAYDTKRDRYIIWGGGHNDYGGNEIYVFSLDSLKWSRIWGPSPDIPAPASSACVDTYSDGNPRVTHTYDGLDYLPNVDRFYQRAGSLYCATGWSSAAISWMFDFDALKWTRKAPHPNEGSVGMVSAYDPVTGHVFVDGGGSSTSRFYDYDPVSNVWTQRTSPSVGASSHQTGTLDPKRRKFFRVGENRMEEYDLPASGVCPGRALATTGPQDIVAGNYPGVDYDPVSQRLVGWSGGAKVYSYDPDSKAWTADSAAGENPGAVVPQGTFNRWRYVPSKNIFIIVNSISASVYAYRHTAVASAPQWYLDLLKTGALTEAAPVSVPGGGLFAYPNPFKGSVTLKSAATRVEILDLKGRLIKVLNSTDGGFAWNGPSAGAGIFIARSRDAGRISTLRLMHLGR